MAILGIILRMRLFKQLDIRLNVRNQPMLRDGCFIGFTGDFFSNVLRIEQVD
jgi:hypothetical protein